MKKNRKPNHIRSLNITLYLFSMLLNFSNANSMALTNRIKNSPEKFEKKRDQSNSEERKRFKVCMPLMALGLIGTSLNNFIFCSQLNPGVGAFEGGLNITTPDNTSVNVNQINWVSKTTRAFTEDLPSNLKKIETFTNPNYKSSTWENNCFTNHHTQGWRCQDSYCYGSEEYESCPQIVEYLKTHNQTLPFECSCPDEVQNKTDVDYDLTIIDSLRNLT